MAYIDLNDAIIAQVRQSADIVEYISQVTPLKLAGRSYKGLCPFHREKTPSFNVDREKGVFYCFGCGTGGDVFKFLSLTERFTFPEAVEHVAARLGIQIPKRKRDAKESEKDELFAIIEDAAESFHQALKWKPNPAEQYLSKRGVVEKIWQNYGFGYAPDSWDYLLTRLGGRYSAAKLEASGLALPRKSGTGHYDRFRNRLMIPIHSEVGTLLGFGGRSLDGSDPKYLNSPESAVFNKSNLLYNLHRAKDQIRKTDRAILVEGYFDAIALDYAGIPGVVASMGTSLTPGQASLLRRQTRRVVICYDGDDAGRHAALRGTPILLSAGIDVSIVHLGAKHDPDSMIRDHGVDGFMERLSAAKDAFSFALGEWVTSPATMTSAGKREKLEAFIPLLSSVSDQVMRNDAAQRVADGLRLEFATVWERVKGRSTTQVDRQLVAPVSTGEKEVLRSLLQGELSQAMFDRLREDYFEDPSCLAIFLAIKAVASDGQSLDFSEIATHLRGEAEQTRLSELAFAEESCTTATSLESNLQRMERRSIERRKKEIQERILEAIREGDLKRERELDLEKEDLSKRVHRLK